MVYTIYAATPLYTKTIHSASDAVGSFPPLPAMNILAMMLWFGVASCDLLAVFDDNGRFYNTTSEDMPVGFLQELEKVFLPLVVG